MAFERFTKTGRTFKPKASIWSRGQIGFNQGAVERFGLEKYEYVIFFYDSDNKQIGFKFTKDKSEEGVIKLNTKNTGAVASGKSFLEYYGIEHGVTKQYDLKVDKDNDLYIIDLEKGSVE